MASPVCYQCNQKSTQAERKFCSDACAIDWAEFAANQRGDEWCPDCNAWLEPTHPHAGHQAGHAGKTRNLPDSVPPPPT